MSLGLGGVGQQQNVQSAQSVQVGTLSDAAKQAQTLQIRQNTLSTLLQEVSVIL